MFLRNNIFDILLASRLSVTKTLEMGEHVARQAYRAITTIWEAMRSKMEVQDNGTNHPLPRPTPTKRCRGTCPRGECLSFRKGGM